MAVTAKGTPKLAEIASTDRAKIHELYRPDWRAWFEDQGEENGGPDDPRLVLIAVDIQLAHYLEVNNPQVVVLFELVKGMITGKQPDFPEVQEVSTPSRRR